MIIIIELTVIFVPSEGLRLWRLFSQEMYTTHNTLPWCIWVWQRNSTSLEIWRLHFRWIDKCFIYRFLFRQMSPALLAVQDVLSRICVVIIACTRSKVRRLMLVRIAIEVSVSVIRWGSRGQGKTICIGLRCLDMSRNFRSGCGSSRGSYCIRLGYLMR